MNQLLRALRHRPFALLWTGQVLSRMGDFAYEIIIAWWVLQETGSAITMSSVVVVSFLSVAFFIFLFKNRFPRWGAKLALVLGVAAVLGVALELLPGLGQKNAEIIALTLPINLALWAGTVRIRRGGMEEPLAKNGETG